MLKGAFCCGTQEKVTILFSYCSAVLLYSQQNEQIKEEQIEQEEEGGPSSTPPPPLSPQFSHEIQDELSSELPPLSPVTAPSPCTLVHANNLQQMSAITQATPPASDLLADTVFGNSDLVNSYEAEEPPVADSDSTAYDRDMGYVNFRLSCFFTYF
jgi:hypothetical protein